MTFHDFESPAMQFGPGWILTFAAVFFLNAFLLAHWFLTDFRTRRWRKAPACALLNAAAAVPFFVYFARFFGGMSHEPYMIPLSYAAGFYLCFSLYASGAFFVTDVFRAVRRAVKALIGKVKRARLEEGEAGSAASAGGAGDAEVPADARMPGGERKDSAAQVTKRSLPAPFKPRFTIGVAIVCIACSLAAFYTPEHITTTRYDVEIDRGEGAPAHIRAVFISDTHIGGAVRERGLDAIIAASNEAKPDIVLLGGDIIDEGTPAYLKQYMAAHLPALESTYGTYYILGNHDDYRGDTAAVISLFESAGVTCLVDKTVPIDDKFYLIGRADSRLRRQPLAELESEITADLPAIVLDHHPRTDETSRSNSVALQLSGHTHDGQIFPFHLLDPLGIISLHYGRYDRGRAQIIVSSGAGEYAAPVRLGSPAEILVIDIELK
jgi:predicted MPP superfamily phosphohydrolase